MLGFLLPEWIFADDERAYSFSNQEINQASGGRMQVVIYASSAFVSDAIKLVRVVLLFHLLLKMLSLLVIELVHMLNRTPVNKPRSKSCFV